MKKLALLLVSFVLVFSGYSSENRGFYSEVELIFACDLAVDAKLLKKDTGQFIIEITHIIKDKRYGLKRGDKLKIKKANWPECGSSLATETLGNARLYLQKSASSWEVFQLKEEAVVIYQSPKSYVSIYDQFFISTADSIRQFLKEIQRVYTLDSSGQIVNVTDVSPLTQLTTKKEWLDAIEKKRAASIKTAEKQAEVSAPNLPCSVAEQPPSWNDFTDFTALSKFISEHVKHPVTAEPLAGKVYVEVEIESTGLLLNPIVRRGLRSDYDASALKFIKSMQQWQPAKYNGKAIGCTLIMPVIFKNLATESE